MDTKMDKEVKILAIESSCDETAAAVVVDGKDIRSNIVHTQIPVHTLYGGVVPEIASRNHIEKIDGVIKQALSEAGETFESIDAIAVTAGPGLIGALLVGVAEAKAISFAAGKPLIAVHHIMGHISACYINSDLKPPFYCLVASGGHTTFLKITDYNEYELVAKSMDDAAGEAFDKVARALGLGYPGGPKIQEAAKTGNAEAYILPHPKVGEGFDFSFSGLKTAVLNIINEKKMKGEDINVSDMAASFQKTVVDVLVEHCFAAIEEDIKNLALCGGVAANSVLREAFAHECDKRGLAFHVPEMKYCTDNAAMIGMAAYHSFIKNEFAPLDLNATAQMGLRK